MAKQQTETKARAAEKKPAATKTPVAKKGEVSVLFIRTRRGVPTRRRAGYRFNREPYGIALDLLSDEQIEALKGDANLVVEEGVVDAEATEGGEDA